MEKSRRIRVIYQATDKSLFELADPSLYIQESFVNLEIAMPGDLLLSVNGFNLRGLTTDDKYFKTSQNSVLMNTFNEFEILKFGFDKALLNPKRPVSTY